MRKIFAFLTVMTMFIAPTALWSREIGPKWLDTNYTKNEVMIPMRDGIKLYTAVYSPRDNDPHPVIMMRTPYGLNPYGKGFADNLRTYFGAYVENKYIVVFQNVRGTFLSEGEFENIRPVGQSATDDATDTYDTAQWIINNLNTNQKIGVVGVSYNGFYATVAALAKHPAIKAVSPQAPIADWFIGDDFHTNGSFMSSGYLFGASMFRHRKKPAIKRLPSLEKMEGDSYEWFFNKGSISNLLTTYRDSLGFLDQMMQHPTYDEFWKSRNPLNKIKDIDAAVLVVGGWYDAEDCFGTFETYRKFVELSPDTETYLAAGPFCHGGWNKFNINNLGDAWFGKDNHFVYHKNIEYPFFAWYLEGKGEKPSYKAVVLPSGETTKDIMEDISSESRWEYLDSWPYKNAEPRRFYFAEHGNLTSPLESSRTCESSDLVSTKTKTLPEDSASKELSWTYTSDPQRPIPFREDTEAGTSRDFMTADQRFATRRTDVLVFKTPVLEAPLHVAGPLKAVLKTSITTTDADLFVKIVDVRPDGKHILIRYGVLPARFRNGLGEAVPMIPGQVADIIVEMNDINHIFMPGHRLEVLVMSSNYPLHQMNPQQCVENIYLATESDYVKTEVTVHEGSYIELPVVK